MPDTTAVLAQPAASVEDAQDALNQGAEAVTNTDSPPAAPAKDKPPALTPEQRETKRLHAAYDKLAAEKAIEQAGDEPEQTPGKTGGDANPEAKKAQQDVDARRHRERVAVMLKRVDGMPEDAIKAVLENPALASRFDAKWLEARTKHQEAQDSVGPTISSLQKKVKELESKLKGGNPSANDPSDQDDDAFELPEDGPLLALYNYHANELGDERAARLHVEAVRSLAGRGKGNNTPDPLANLPREEQAAVILTKFKPDLDELAAGYGDLLKDDESRLAVLEEAEQLMQNGTIAKGTPAKDVLAMAAKIALGPPPNTTKADRLRLAKVTREQTDGAPLPSGGQRGRPPTVATPGSKEEHYDAFDMLMAGKKPADVQAILRRRATG